MIKDGNFDVMAIHLQIFQHTVLWMRIFTLKKLQQKYATETCQLYMRMNNHRTSFNEYDTNISFELNILSYMFSIMLIQILEYNIDATFRLKSKGFYILRLKSLYHYGLNTKIKYYTGYLICVYNHFSSVFISTFHYKKGKCIKHRYKLLQRYIFIHLLFYKT